MARKRREATDIDQHVYPKLQALGIPREQVRRDISTLSSGLLRGDLWISQVPDHDPTFEANIISLIECKDHSAAIGDRDWKDALSKGRKKALGQGLNAFFVTNTKSLTRCYNAHDVREISLDGRPITEIQGIPILKALQTQVRRGISDVVFASFAGKTTDPNRFRATLWTLRQLYRSKGISKGSEDSMIKTTLTFCILKLISEQQDIARTIPRTILLWRDWRAGRVHRDIKDTIKDLTALPMYAHLADCLDIDNRLDSDSCDKIRRELTGYSLYGSDFDFFGLIYESLANANLKKDFGEFYTPRHIIRTIVKLLLKDEHSPRPLSICDPACGTGGFLVEAFLFLQRNYRQAGRLDRAALQSLKKHTFHGFDTNATVAIPYARTNMLMADDGGTNIGVTNDSLVALPTNQYDYILTNVPYGDYDGDAPIENFSFTNRRRYELLFVEKIIEALKPGGSAAIIVPDGLVEATSYAGYRERLLHEATVQAVVSLPPFVFEPYTTEKTYVLFLTKKTPDEHGRIQRDPIWHFIVDADGFQGGKKRYPINESDLPDVEAMFMRGTIPGKAGSVPISEVNTATYYSLCSEFFLRRPRPIEVEISAFRTIIQQAGRLVSRTPSTAR